MQQSIITTHTIPTESHLPRGILFRSSLRWTQASEDLESLVLVCTTRRVSDMIHMMSNILTDRDSSELGKMVLAADAFGFPNQMNASPLVQLGQVAPD